MANPPSPFERRLAQFDEFITPLNEGYTSRVFNFIALKKGKELFLLRGRVILGVALPNISLKEVFRSTNIIAAQLNLATLGTTYQQLVRTIMKEGFSTPFGKLSFQNRVGSKSSYSPFHAEGLQSQNRLAVFAIECSEKHPPEKIIELDWELRAASVPYESLHELMSEYATGPLAADSSVLEVVAPQIAVVSNESRINGRDANVVLRMGRGFDPRKLSFGYRVQSGGKVERRTRIEGIVFDWKEEDNVLIGRLNLSVTDGALLYGVVSYLGFAQHYWWISDPTTSQNPQRAAYHRFDPQFEVIGDFLSKTGKGNSRDLETGVTWLLWMLGFNSAHLGSTGKTQDAPDILAVTPSGKWVVIECTTGLLNTDRKLPNLLDRTIAVKRSLSESGFTGTDVIPLIISSKSREELAGELEQASKSGVAVIAKEDLNRLFERTMFRVDADGIFNLMVQSINSPLS